jgi:hypothetical protein
MTMSNTSEVRVQPGLRRVQEAVAMDGDALKFLIRSTQRVIDHYKRVLAVHQMAQSDRASILDHIAREEEKLRSLIGLEDRLPIKKYSRAA